MLPLHAFALICMGRYSPRLYVAFSTYYAIGTLASMQVPFVGFQPTNTSEHLAAQGVFGLLQIIAFSEYLRSIVPSKNLRTALKYTVPISIVLGIASIPLLEKFGLVHGWSGRLYSLFDTGYVRSVQFANLSRLHKLKAAFFFPW